jgi:hypothetical protein
MSDPTRSPTTANASPPTGFGSGARTGKAPAIVGAIGVLLVLAAAGTVALKSGILAGGSGTATLSFVNQRDINDAAATLTQSVAGGLVDDARRCKIPLVSMTIAKGTAQIGSTVRIRAGSYISPLFRVTEGTQRIAMPYPEPYGAGAGTYIVEGTAQGAILGLTPTRVLTELPGSQRIPVAWRAVSPC